MENMMFWHWLAGY